jgi:hypothetical protein
VERETIDDAVSEALMRAVLPYKGRSDARCSPDRPIDPRRSWVYDGTVIRQTAASP